MSHIDKKPLDDAASVALVGEVSHFQSGQPGAKHAENPAAIKTWGGSRAGAGRKPKPQPVPERALGPRWYIAQTYGHGEETAVIDMARQGWRGYLPLTAIWQRDRVLPTMMHKITVPLFPGFVFVEFDRDGATWGCIREYCHGVRDILRGAGGRPCPVPVGQVEALIADDARRLQIEPVSVRQEPRLAGCLVRVKAGALSGLHGSVMACDGLRTRVAVQMFGQETPVEMAWGDVDCV